METARLIDLIPWMEYEFRVIATNTLGTGEPSLSSPKIRTEGAGKYDIFLENVYITLLYCTFRYILLHNTIHLSS